MLKLDEGQRKAWDRMGHQAGQHSVGASFRSEEHEFLRARWQRIAYLLGAFAFAGTSVAAAGLFTGADQGSTWAIVGGTLAAAAAGLTGLNTFLKPQAEADAHEKAKGAFEVLRGDFRDFRDITLNSATSFDAGVSAFEGLKERRRQLLEEEAPAVTERARKMVAKRRERRKGAADKGRS